MNLYTFVIKKLIYDLKNSNISFFKCVLCNKNFNKKEYLITHLLNIHLELTINCKDCNKLIKKSYFSEHNKNFHDEDNIYKWSCENCHIDFKHEKIYNRHLKTDKHLFLVKNQNDEIKKEIVEKEDIKEKSSNYKKINCDKCDIKFSSINSLNRHINSVHEKINIFNCDLCNKIFTRTDLLRRHIKSVHEKETIKCSHCNQDILKRDKSRHEKNCEKVIQYYKYPGDSKNERWISRILMEHNINFKLHYRHKNLSKLPYDFYLPDKNTIIETHGLQHFIPMSYRNGQISFDRTIKNDKIKKIFV